MADDEDVIFENSPLEKYLKEIEYSDYEETKRHAVEGVFENRTTDDFSDGLENVVLEKHDLNWTSLEAVLGITPSSNDLETHRKDYIFVVANSGILSEDDIGFLSHFDQELFQSRESSKSDNECKSFVQNEMVYAFSWREYLASGCVLAVAVLLAIVADLIFPSVLLLILLLLVSAFKCLNRFRFIRQHCKNLEDLKSYSGQVKKLAQLLRKAIIFIQEMELTLRGCTFAGMNNKLFFLEKENDLTPQRVYPALRKTILNNIEELLFCSQKAAKQLIECFPLNLEVNRMFTSYLSTASGKHLCPAYKELGCLDILSLKNIKTLASTFVNLQSEFLSRFLLCLSVEANNGDLVKLHSKLFRNISKMLRTPLAVISNSLMVISKSYHVHKSAWFAEKKEEEPPPKTNNKWLAFDNAIHSLELHLQAGILRIQSLQKIYRELASTETEDTISEAEKNLEATFEWLKVDLNSAVTCWEEGENRLNGLFKREPMKQITKRHMDFKDDLNLQESHIAILDVLEEEGLESDKVFEGFSDPFDESVFDQPILKAEDLAEEKRKLQESQHLLQELKVILSSKAKDPLITSAGFVQPVKWECQDMRSTQNLTDTRLQLDIVSSSRDKDMTESQLNNHVLCVSENQNHKTYAETQGLLPTIGQATDSKKDTPIANESKPHISDQFCDTVSHQQPPLFSNLQSSIAFSAAASAAAAAAAVARSKIAGLSEERFVCEDSE